MPADKTLILKPRGCFADIMCDINEEYRQYVRYDKGQRVIYLRVLMEIYGCIKLALPWYNFYTITLKDEGYKLNEYKKYVSNKTINGKQCAVVWYIDNIKASHVESKFIDNLLETIKNHFGEITITIGKKHTFLGMNIRITEDKKIKIEREAKQMETIEAFEEELEGEVTSLAHNHILYVNEDAELLYENKKKVSKSDIKTFTYSETGTS